MGQDARQGSDQQQQQQASDQQRDRLRGVAQNDQDTIDDVIRIDVAASGVDARTYALTNLAALITSGIADPRTTSCT